MLVTFNWASFVSLIPKYTHRSSLPGRRRAESSKSGRLVAAIRNTSLFEFMPEIETGQDEVFEDIESPVVYMSDTRNFLRHHFSLSHTIKFRKKLRHHSIHHTTTVRTLSGSRVGRMLQKRRDAKSTYGR